MRNIFAYYMPPSNAEAMVHYEDTIRRKVPAEVIRAHVSRDVADRLQKVFGHQSIAVWGSRDSSANRAKFDRMKEGDEILIVEGSVIKLLGRVAGKDVNPLLSQKLWKNLRGENTEGWDLISFIANPREIELPFAQFAALVGWKPDFQLRGFTSVAEERLTDFYQRYDDLYSILLRLKAGMAVREVAEPDRLQDAPWSTAAPLAGGPLDEAAEPPGNPSEHLRMQWLLLKMGRRAGQKVWAPRNDQSRITSAYEFRDFEESLTSGIDAQVKYVENIDVVWKEEFRIDAAFEIENSTSIYSGLLRFADLTMVAPNTVYPMFIVAPAERRNRVREQLTRPTFRHLKIAEKVRYLSYDRVREIDDFFGETGGGLSVEIFTGKSELLNR
jgi:hypothetical protein